MRERWIHLVGAVNVRDLGGLPTTDGRTTTFGRVLRSDNLQSLTGDDVERLTGSLGVRDVVDLRTSVEVTSEGPGPLTQVPDVTIHHLSLYPEVGERTDVEADSVLPWNDADGTKIWESAGLYYTNYLRQRPDSVVTALRTMASSRGATIAHCAAGKDRTGVVCAMALSVAGVQPDAIVADYVLTGDRIEAILGRLKATATYAPDLDSRPAVDGHRPRAEAMWTFLGYLDTEFGGPLGWLEKNGWTPADTDALRARLLTG